MKMVPNNKFSGILEKVLGYGYQIHPGALKIIESLEEEKALEVLSSFPEKFPEAIVIEAKHVEGVWDLRIKARFDDEKERCTLIFKRDMTEKSANITLEEARKLGEAATLERIKNALVGKGVEIEGVKLNGGNFLVKDIREV